jgi:hypothetical protein
MTESIWNNHITVDDQGTIRVTPDFDCSKERFEDDVSSALHIKSTMDEFHVHLKVEVCLVEAEQVDWLQSYAKANCMVLVLRDYEHADVYEVVDCQEYKELTGKSLKPGTVLVTGWRAKKVIYTLYTESTNGVDNHQ